MNQIFAPLLEPVGAVWCLMILGVFWLLGRRQWRSAVWLSFPTVLLFIIGSTSLVEKLVAAEEAPWVGGSAIEGRKSEASMRRAGGAPADAVVALGGGQHVSHHDVLGFAMEDAGSRILTAIELVRLGHARTLVLGGSAAMPGTRDVPSIYVIEDWVTSWGLAGCAVTNLGVCINTHDEAVVFRKMALERGWLKVVLVTSALHMRRSIALFRTQGIEVTPVAADFQVAGVSQGATFSPFPRQHRFSLLTRYLHEKIGWWVYRLRGWI